LAPGVPVVLFLLDLLCILSFSSSSLSFCPPFVSRFLSSLVLSILLGCQPLCLLADAVLIELLQLLGCQPELGCTFDEHIVVLREVSLALVVVVRSLVR
jgi:hypothetical protein